MVESPVCRHAANLIGTEQDYRVQQRSRSVSVNEATQSFPNNLYTTLNDALTSASPRRRTQKTSNQLPKDYSSEDSRPLDRVSARAFLRSSRSAIFLALSGAGSSVTP